MKPNNWRAGQPICGAWVKAGSRRLGVMYVAFRVYTSYSRVAVLDAIKQYATEFYGGVVEDVWHRGDDAHLQSPNTTVIEATIKWHA